MTCCCFFFFNQCRPISIQTPCSHDMLMTSQPYPNHVKGREVEQSADEERNCRQPDLSIVLKPGLSC